MAAMTQPIARLRSPRLLGLRRLAEQVQPLDEHRPHFRDLNQGRLGEPRHVDILVLPETLTCEALEEDAQAADRERFPSDPLFAEHPPIGDVGAGPPSFSLPVWRR